MGVGVEQRGLGGLLHRCIAAAPGGERRRRRCFNSKLHRPLPTTHKINVHTLQRIQQLVSPSNPMSPSVDLAFHSPAAPVSSMQATRAARSMQSERIAVDAIFITSDRPQKLQRHGQLAAGCRFYPCIARENEVWYACNVENSSW
jgi:hypothetical protein